MMIKLDALHARTLSDSSALGLLAIRTRVGDFSQLSFLGGGDTSSAEFLGIRAREPHSPIAPEQTEPAMPIGAPQTGLGAPNSPGGRHG